MTLNFRVVWGALDLTAFPYSIVWGTELGAPESVTQVLATLLQDGEYEITDRAGNRELKLPILTEGINLEALAAAEEALILEARKPLNTLAITPGDGQSATTVFDTFAGTVELSRSDDYEIAGYRVWNASIRALPFGRDAALTSVVATSSTTAPSTTSIDDGSATTNWTGTSTVTSSGGLVRVTTPNIAGETYLGKNVAFNTANGSGGNWIVVDWKTTQTPMQVWLNALSTDAGGVWFYLHPQTQAQGGYTPVAGAPAAGFTRTYHGPLTNMPVSFDDWSSWKFRADNMRPNDTLDIDQIRVATQSGTVLSTFEDGTSATNAYAYNGGAPVVSSGSLRTTATGTAASLPVKLTRSSLTTDVTSTRYIFIDWPEPATGGKGYGIAYMNLTSGATTVTAQRAANVLAPTTNYNRTYFAVPAAITTTVNAIEFGLTDSPSGTELAIDQVSRTNVLPGFGSNRQQNRSITVGGTARTRASLAIAATNSGETLGDVTCLYTRTASASTGLAPPLRNFRSASDAVTADATLASGSRNALGGTMTFLIPAYRFAQATYELTALLRATSVGTYTVTWTTQLMTAANAAVPESAVTATGTTTIGFTTANAWGMYDLGSLQLPNVPVAADSTLVVRLTLIASNSVVQIDDAYLFDLDNGALSWATTTSLTRLEARTADLTLPRPSYWGSYTNLGLATGLVRSDWRVVSFGTHIFEPGGMDVFTLTLGTETTTATVTYYRSWHTHARLP